MPDAGVQRAQRILDSASELVLRWGSKRVTIEEVAKHAGIGKGTVYLHFTSRAWLFTCVLMRESLAVVDALVAEIRRDPAAALMAEQTRLAFLEVQRRPLMRAMFVRDRELLGELAHEGAVEPLREWNGDLAADLFRLLREHGLLRTDIDVDTQQYVVGAVQTGFYLHQPDTDPETAAAALSYTIHAAVEPPGDADPNALAAVAPAILARYERFRATLAAAIAGLPAAQKGPT
jgi:AcrR family transcriptional regulator